MVHVPGPKTTLLLSNPNRGAKAKNSAQAVILAATLLTLPEGGPAAVPPDVPVEPVALTWDLQSGYTQDSSWEAGKGYLGTDITITASEGASSYQWEISGPSGFGGEAYTDSPAWPYSPSSPVDAGSSAWDKTLTAVGRVAHLHVPYTPGSMFIYAIRLLANGVPTLSGFVIVVGTE